MKNLKFPGIRVNSREQKFMEGYSGNSNERTRPELRQKIDPKRSCKELYITTDEVLVVVTNIILAS